ncbi:unnamed protein product [Paramecium octaurelia]|uniref:EF-hand domain-containing protein n=1 Tax=Paramecium octaurelia TaxID=43137 RepID=A0A8S1UJ30_PAROT|nr:unnamed protein product [Paramecium octaurelia]
MNFYSFILLAVEAEAKLEEIRMSLASIDSFESHTTYNRLDQPRISGLKPENIFEFLCDNDIEVTQDQLDYIFRVLDEDSDKIITYRDFKSAILPKRNAQLREQAQNHKGYDLPVDMLLPKEIETLLSQFMNQLKENYLLYQEIQEKIELNQLNICDNNNQITVDSLQEWLQQLEKNISEEVLQNFVDIIQGQPQKLKILLDQIYTENEEDQDYNDEQEEEENDNDNEEEIEVENDNQEKQQEDVEQIQQEQKLEQAQQNNAKDDQDGKDSVQNNQQVVQSQVLNHNNMDNQHLYNYSDDDIEFEIYYLKKKIYSLELLLGIVPQSIHRSYVGYFYEQQNREIQYYSRVSHPGKFIESPSFDSDYLLREKLWLDQQIKNEELKQQLLLIQLKNDIKVSSSGLFTDKYQRYSSASRISQSPLNYSKSYLDYSGQKYSASSKKSFIEISFQRSLNYSNRKF